MQWTLTPQKLPFPHPHMHIMIHISSYPRILICSYPYILICSYPHILTSSYAHILISSAPASASQPASQPAGRPAGRPANSREIHVVFLFVIIKQIFVFLHWQRWWMKSHFPGLDAYGPRWGLGLYCTPHPIQGALIVNKKVRSATCHITMYPDMSQYNMEYYAMPYETI